MFASVRVVFSIVLIGLLVGCAAPKKIAPFATFDETRISETQSTFSFDLDKSRRSAADKIMNVMCEMVRITTARGFRYYRVIERSKGMDKYDLTVTFYKQPPPGLPVIGFNNLNDPRSVTDSMDSVMDVDGYVVSLAHLAHHFAGFRKTINVHDRIH